MNWTELLKSEMDVAFRSTANLIDRVDPNGLDWKPSSGCNWMTMGQLLKHMSASCGSACRAFLTGDFGLPPGVKIEDLPPEEVLPPAENLPTIESVEEAKRLLEQDRVIALETLDQAGEEDLSTKKVAAPWAPEVSYALGRHMLQMVQHLERHKSQLFYYLKLQGKPVTTADLWG